jgi:hypothetical protein
MYRFDIRVAKNKKETRQTISKLERRSNSRDDEKNNAYLARAYSPISRPIPDCLNPTEGACAFKWLTQLALKPENLIN